MGQKVNPIGFRLGVSKEWGSKWYSSKNYAKWLHEDLRLKEVIKQRFSNAGISEIKTEHFLQEVRVFVRVARRRLAVGRGGLEVESLIEDLEKMTKKAVKLDIKEEASPNTCAELIAANIAEQLVRRMAYRRTMKRSLQLAMDSGAKGAKIRLGGRLGGGEIARDEWVKDGSLPLHTLRANIDYATATAFCNYGTIGVKVWVYKDEALEAEQAARMDAARPRRTGPPPRRNDGPPRAQTKSDKPVSGVKKPAAATKPKTEAPKKADK